MYQKRMIGYYPSVIQSILEFQAIVNAEYPEVEDLEKGVVRLLDDAYFLTMTEERVKQWEQILSIKPIPTSTVDQRRDTVIARIRGQGKLNTALINTIVKTFTGGTAESWVENSCLYVVITPPPNNKQFQFDDVMQEIARKTPAHLGLNVKRNFFYWQDIKDNHDDWQQVYDDLPSWNDVYLFVPDFSN